MNDEELRSTLEQIKAQVKAKPENKDKSDDEIDELILDSFFKTYTEGKMSKEDLLALADMMGYGPTEEFENDENAPMNVEPEEGEGEEIPEGITKEDLEETRTIDEGEDKEDFKEKIEDVQEGKGVEDEDVEEDEDEQRKKASELFKVDLTKKED